MKHFSHKRNGIADSACALLLAISFTISPLAVQAQEGVSLDDMWQEHQEVTRPAAIEETEKPSRKTRKPRKSKGLQPPVAEGDLLKSTDKPASGWDSPTPGSSATDSAAGDGDLTKSGATTTSADTNSDSGTTGASTKPSATGSSGLSNSTATSPAAGTSSSSESTTTTTKASPASNTGSASTAKTGLNTPVTLGGSTVTPSSAGSSSVFATPASTTSATETSSSPSNPLTEGGALQPLCKLASLKSSDLVKSGGWPGVGPFSQDQNDNAALVDESKNQLKLKLSGEDVTHAELLLVNQSPKASQLLAVQMNANYLLEAVGALPGKIADFNNDLMKNQEKLSSTTADGSVNLKAGTYVIQIQRKPAQESTVPGNVSFLIALDNQKPSIVASASPRSDTTSFSVYSTPSSTPPQSTTTTPPKTTSTTTPPKTATTPATTTTTTPKSSDDLLHKQFSNLINSWQQVKRSAVKTRQASSLSRILGGNALATQNRAIEWLIENKRFYEMTPVELKVQSYKEITPAAKYEIETYIKERRQLVSADTMKVEKDTTQAYNVVYTVERIRGAWLITDTRMVKPI